MVGLLQQLFNGLVSGSFYALLALGLSVIFGMLGVVNFAHGAFYMLGAFGAFVLLDTTGLSWWVALPLVPLVLGVVGMLFERLLVHRLVALDPLYNFLLTFGVALILQDLIRLRYGVTSQPYLRPELLDGHQFEDFFARNAEFRAEDHRVEHDSYLVRVKSEDKVEEDFDFTELVDTIPADEAFMDPADSGCEM